MGMTEYEAGIYMNSQKERERVVREGNQLLEMMRTPGWKIIEGVIEKLSDPGRLLMDFDTLDRADLKEVVFISGKIHGAQEILKYINRMLVKRKLALQEINAVNSIKKEDSDG